MLIFGIETSCDDTSCAVVQDGRKILSLATQSQIARHEQWSGVVPEIASREHLNNIWFTAQKAFTDAHISPGEIDGIAVTLQPGLVGSLVVGVNFAKGLAYRYGKPLYGINHLLGHIYAAFFDTTPSFPLIALLISGGHTALIAMNSFADWKIVGRTLDDSCGEAFDKTAKHFGLGYPGGPVIDRLAAFGDPAAYRFPIPLRDFAKYGCDFSFSGLKTAIMHFRKKHRVTKADGEMRPESNPVPDNVISEVSSIKSIRDHENVLHERGILEPGEMLTDIAAAFQQTVAQTLFLKTEKALADTGVQTLIVAGGSSANSEIRSTFKNFVQKGIDVHFPPLPLCMDNGAMIAGLAYHMRDMLDGADYFMLDAEPRVTSLRRGVTARHN